MLKKVAVGFAVAFLALSGAAHAEGDGNRYGYDQIAAQKLTAAEKRLNKQRVREPGEPSVLINLAYVYAKTGRAAEATTLYNEVLAQPNVLMALGDGRPAWSHAIAQKAMGLPSGYAARQ